MIIFYNNLGLKITHCCFPTECFRKYNIILCASKPKSWQRGGTNMPIHSKDQYSTEICGTPSTGSMSSDAYNPLLHIICKLSLPFLQHGLHGMKNFIIVKLFLYNSRWMMFYLKHVLLFNVRYELKTHHVVCKRIIILCTAEKPW